MHSSDILWNPRFTHQLVAAGMFRDEPMTVVDVGMRGGAQEHWKLLGDQVQVIGFEPDQEACRLVNEMAPPPKHVCYPYALDSEPRTRTLYRRGWNRSADGLFPMTWWLKRLGVMSPEEVQGDRTDSGDFEELASETVEIETTSLAAIAPQIELHRFEFLKLDVEGAELDVLRGSEPFLTPEGTLGIEAEVRFQPINTGPVFLDIYTYLAARGYFLYNISLNRSSRRALPMPLAWDHRDHRGNPMMLGPTIAGQLDYGDAVFFRDLLSDGFQPRAGVAADLLRILKAASLFEIYNLPDCAAELLLYYRQPLMQIAPVDDLLAQLVPDRFGRPVDLKEYLRLYREQMGRFPAQGPAAPG